MAPTAARAGIRLFDAMPARNAKLASAIMLPGGKYWSRRLEPLLRRGLPGCGAFIAVAADVLPHRRQ